MEMEHNIYLRAVEMFCTFRCIDTIMAVSFRRVKMVITQWLEMVAGKVSM